MMLKQSLVLSGLCLVSSVSVWSKKPNISHSQDETSLTTNLRSHSYGKKFLDTNQKLTCYERAGQQGDSVILTDYAPYLDNYNFNNRAASCCFQGVYVSYKKFLFVKKNNQFTKQAKFVLNCA